MGTIIAGFLLITVSWSVPWWTLLPAPRQTQIQQALTGGYAGYTEGTVLNRHGLPINSTLVLGRVGEPERRFRAAYAYIEVWKVEREEVTIRSRNLHGPAMYERFDIRTGQLLESASKKQGISLPGWAKRLDALADSGPNPCPPNPFPHALSARRLLQKINPAPPRTKQTQVDGSGMTANWLLWSSTAQTL